MKMKIKLRKGEGKILVSLQCLYPSLVMNHWEDPVQLDEKESIKKTKLMKQYKILLALKYYWLFRNSFSPHLIQQLWFCFDVSDTTATITLQLQWQTMRQKGRFIFWLETLVKNCPESPLTYNTTFNNYPAPPSPQENYVRILSPKRKNNPDFFLFFFFL